MKVLAGVGPGRWGPKRGLTGLCLTFAVTPPHADSTWLLLRRIRAESGTRGLFAGECLCVFVQTWKDWAPPRTLTSDPNLRLPLQAFSRGSSRLPPPVPS